MYRKQGLDFPIKTALKIAQLLQLVHITAVGDKQRASVRV